MRKVDPNNIPIATAATLGGVKGDGSTVTLSAAGVLSALGGGAMSTPVSIGTGNASTTAFTLSGTGSTEIVWKGGAIQLGGGVDYTRSGTTITFNTAPASGAIILASWQISVLSTTDAVTLGGQLPAYYATAASVTAVSATASAAGQTTGSPTESYDPLTGAWIGATNSAGTASSTYGTYGQLATIANGATTITLTRDACGNLVSMTEA